MRLHLMLLILFISLSIQAKKANSVEGDFTAVFAKAIFFENVNDDSTLYYANNAFKIALTSQNRANQLDALISIIIAEIKSAKYIEAITHCQLATKISIELKNIDKHIDVLTYIGVVYQSMGLSKNALEFIFEAKKMADEYKYYNKMGNLNYYLGSIYKDLGDLPKGISYARESVSQLTEKNEQNKVFKSYILLANSFENMDSIQKYLNLAESLTSYYQNLQYERMILRNTQALFNEALGNIKSSRSQYIEAITICKLNGYRENLSTLFNNYSYLMMIEGKYDSAKYFLDQALKISLEVKNVDLEAEIYDSYCDYYKTIGEYRIALNYLAFYIEKNEEYKDQQRIKESLFLSAVFESDQKEKELLIKENHISQLKISMLGMIVLVFLFIGIGVFFKMKFRLGKIRLEALKKGKDLEVADALITGQDVERKRIAMDLHDGIGARFGSLRLLVSEPANSTERITEINHAVDTIYEEIRNISHRMLPPQLESKGLISAMNEMISTMNKTSKFEVEMKTNLDRRLGNVLEMNLFYIVYELVNNAIKHSKGDFIVIQIIDHHDEIQLSVEDNGSGLGVKDKPYGMGLNNIKTRVEYLGGTFFIETNESVTQFFVEIPIKI